MPDQNTKETSIKRLFIKPAQPNDLVPHPHHLTRYLRPQGEWVIENKQVKRYLRFGDVVVVEAPKFSTKGNHVVRNKKALTGSDLTTSTES